MAGGVWKLFGLEIIIVTHAGGNSAAKAASGLIILGIRGGVGGEAPPL